MGYKKLYIVPSIVYVLVAVCLIIAGFPETQVDQNLPDGIEYGVCGHNVTSEDIGLMEEAGFTWLRIDSWMGFESVAQKANDSGLSILGIMDFSQSNHINLHDWNISVAMNVENTTDTVRAWEILNEPVDILPFNNVTEYSEKTYFELLKSSYRIIKTLDSNLTVVGFGGIRIIDSKVVDYNWTRDLIRMGALNYCDAVSIHMYSTISDSLKTASNFRSAIDRVSQLIEQKPIWVTEVGQPSERDQVSFIGNVYPMLYREHIAHVFWYEFRDTVPFEGMFFGLLQGSYAPRESYNTFKARAP